MGIGKKKRRQYPKGKEKMGTGKKKRRQYPKEKKKMGIGKKKCIVFHVLQNGSPDSNSGGKNHTFG